MPSSNLSLLYRVLLAGNCPSFLRAVGMHFTGLKDRWSSHQVRITLYSSGQVPALLPSTRRRIICSTIGAHLRLLYFHPTLCSSTNARRRSGVTGVCNGLTSRAFRLCALRSTEG